MVLQQQMKHLGLAEYLPIVSERDPKVIKDCVYLIVINSR